jgi:hypothetical protein
MDNMAATVTQATASTRQTAATANHLVKAALRLDRLVGTSTVVAQAQRAPALVEPIPTPPALASVAEEGGATPGPRAE